MTPPSPHGRARYTKGCRCGECRAANREYQRRYRSGAQLHALPDEPPGAPEAPAAAPGRVSAAVIAQLADLPGAAERPGLAAIAVALAEVLDNPDAVPQYAAAAHRLTEVLDRLAKGSQRRGRLAAVRTLTRGD